MSIVDLAAVGGKVSGWTVTQMAVIQHDHRMLGCQQRQPNLRGWLDAIGQACGIAQDKVDAAKNKFLPAIGGALAAMPIKGRVIVSGYEGSELLVARLLIESGAEVPYVGTACPRTPWNRPISPGSTRTASRSSSAPRWSRIWRRSNRWSRISPSAPHRSCRRPRNA